MRHYQNWNVQKSMLNVNDELAAFEEIADDALATKSLTMNEFLEDAAAFFAASRIVIELL